MNPPKLTKKQKKGLAFRERKGKKPRPESGALLEEELAIPQADLAEEEDILTVPDTQTLPLTKPKKRKRDVEKDAKDDSTAVVKGEADAEDSLQRTTKRRKLGGKDNEDKAKSVAGKTRFILFVGTYATYHTLPLHNARSRQFEVHDLPRSYTRPLCIMWSVDSSLA